MKGRLVILWLGMLLVVVVTTVLVWRREDLAKNGRVVLLQLVSEDGPPLMPENSVYLQYLLGRRIRISDERRLECIIVTLDENQVAQFRRFDNDQIILAANEQRICYQQQDRDVFIGPRYFYFQEGQAVYYENAEYAEMRVSESGEVALIGLRGPNFELLGPP